MAGLNIAQIKGEAKRILGYDISEQEADEILGEAWDQGQWGADRGVVESILKRRQTSTGSFQAQSAITSADDAFNQMMGEMESKYRQLGERYMEYEEKSPFSFDEMLARASGEERLGPYYKAELDDYIGGIERQRGSIEGERTLMTELNRIATGREKRDLEEAIKASEEGFAGAGLYESGARLRETGLQEIGGAERKRERESRLEYGEAGLGRREEEIGAGEKTYRRKWKAGRETDILSDIEQQRRQKRAQWEVGRMEALGPEFMGRQLTGGGLESFLSSAYQ